MSEYSYRIQYGVTQFLKDGRVLSDKEVLNELDGLRMNLDQFIDEVDWLKEVNDELVEENMRLREKETNNRIYFDDDFQDRGCSHCIHEKGGICEILLKGTYGVDGLSWCNLKHYERCFDEKSKWFK